MRLELDCIDLEAALGRLAPTPAVDAGAEVFGGLLAFDRVGNASREGTGPPARIRGGGGRTVLGTPVREGNGSEECVKEEGIDVEELGVRA
jgi:hypothetical protein